MCACSLVGIQTHNGSAPIPATFTLWHIYRVILDPSASPMGLCGFSVIPRVKGGLFFFQKVLYKLVVGSGNEDSHGNNTKITLQSLSLQDSPFEAGDSLPAQLVRSWEWAALWVSTGMGGESLSIQPPAAGSDGRRWLQHREFLGPYPG